MSLGNGLVAFAMQLRQGLGFFGGVRVVRDEEFTVSDKLGFGFLGGWLKGGIGILQGHTAHVVSVTAQSDGFLLVPSGQSKMIISDDQLAWRMRGATNH